VPLDPACSSPQLEPITLCALVLGRIQIGIARASDGVLQWLAARSIRESLLAALRQEGHAFTEERFFAWYAGLETLSDGASSRLRAPRALCHAVLTELRHSPWAVLAQSAEHLQRAFMAPSDFHGGADHEELHSVIEEARALVSALARSDEGHPFHAVGLLFEGAMKSPRFAREERCLNVVRGITADRDDGTNCRWALDILAGRYLAPHHGLPLAVPLPGLVSLPAAPHGAEDFLATDAAMATAMAIAGLHDAFRRLDHMLEQAERDVAVIDTRLRDRRSSGRSRELAIFLAGFGSLSGRQIEQVIGVSRPGVRIVTSALEAEGLAIAHRSRNAARVYSFAPHDAPSRPAQDCLSELALTSSAIDEYEASMQAIDGLLRRSSVTGLSD
jgi:DNA-binding FadR family transcriptional regulator